jgi:acyl carrier protein
VAAAVVLRTAGSISANELRSHVRSRLAAYKVPARIVEVEQLPRNSLGKVDRRALAKLAGVQIDFDPPAGPCEIRIAQIFADVLKVARVGRNDSFFDLGGDSLRAMRVLASVEEAFAVSASLDLLFDHPTAAEFAVGVRSLLGASASRGDLGSSP